MTERQETYHGRLDLPKDTVVGSRSHLVTPLLHPYVQPTHLYGWYRQGKSKEAGEVGQHSPEAEVGQYLPETQVWAWAFLLRLTISLLLAWPQS